MSTFYRFPRPPSFTVDSLIVIEVCTAVLFALAMLWIN